MQTFSLRLHSKDLFFNFKPARLAVWRGLSLFSQVGLSWVELAGSELWWLQNGYNLGPGISGLIFFDNIYKSMILRLGKADDYW
jgi:hypothetical protein